MVSLFQTFSLEEDYNKIVTDLGKEILLANDYENSMKPILIVLLVESCILLRAQKGRPIHLFFITKFNGQKASDIDIWEIM